MCLDHVYVKMKFIFVAMITSRNKGGMGKVKGHNSTGVLKVASNFMWMGTQAYEIPSLQHAGREGR